MPAKKTNQEDARTKQTLKNIITESIQRTRDMKLVPKIEEFDSVKSITELVNLIIGKAWEAKASDIHIDPTPEMVIVRYRIDGIAYDVLSLPKEEQPLIVTRIKVLSGLRTDEHAMAQDGRFRLPVASTEIDLRVSIVPTYSGEDVVMRLLVSGARLISLEELGFSDKDMETIRRYMRKPYGMILATGPTGSGKTTTLYAILQVLNTRQVSVVTIEDPIEYSVPGITQIPVNVQTNLTFAAGLRSIVRQDPNIIMVGEIRDNETAAIAVNAAMTGHLLLTTIHTNDAATTLPRLLDMGIEPFLIGSTVNIAIGQRLIRKLCQDCRTSYVLTEEERKALTGLVNAELLTSVKKAWKAEGCDTCSHTGYVKRIGIYEVLEVTEPVRQLIMRRASADEIHEAAMKGGMTPMLEDGFQKAAAGITSIAELLRVIHD
ncbi:MAG: GspE/PulE family protein [Candidatus Uhrbacteria bacterium]|nr:GspE/PulE family protein [Candidatus Uhrbacteria bacterium]